MGAQAWACMRYNADYRKHWAAHAGAPVFETAGFPPRVQTEADLPAEADWALLAWEYPGAEVWRSPFWSGIAMLVDEPDLDLKSSHPAPSTGGLRDAQHRRAERGRMCPLPPSRAVSSRSVKTPCSPAVVASASDAGHKSLSEYFIGPYSDI